ncbi:MAG: response regulator, partial [Chitinophagaceae bacterium]
MERLKTILIDDEPRGLSSMQKLLQINCPEADIIGSYTNPDEAIERIKIMEPHLIFLDIAMPVKNGFDLL